MHFLRKIIDSAALARLRQPRRQWIFKLSGTPIREAGMYAFPYLLDPKHHFNGARTIFEKMAHAEFSRWPK